MKSVVEGLKQLVVYAFFAVLGFVVVPLIVVVIVDSVRQVNRPAGNDDMVPLKELLDREKEVLKQHEANVNVMLVSSVVGLLGGVAVARWIVSRKSVSGHTVADCRTPPDGAHSTGTPLK